jgi:shikimate kinase
MAAMATGEGGAVSAELKDLRAKITARTWCFLESESRATSKDISELVREILSEWSAVRLHAHIEAAKLLAAEGNLGDSEGNPRE